MAYFDDNDLENVNEENLRYFYEEFSASIRKQLLSKNLLSPQNVYDVLYPRTREALLTKNIPKIIDLEESSKSIRDALIAKLVSENISLEKLSEDTRNSLLARNKLIQSADNLLESSSVIRKNNLEKNSSSESDLLKDSNIARQNNIAKNNENVSLKNNIDSNNGEFLKNNMAANKPNNTDLENDSTEFLKNNMSSNKSNSSDLESDSAEFLKNNISANKPNNSDLESDSSEFLKNNIAANKSNGSDLEIDSSEFLKNNISANKPNNSDLETDSAEFLKNNISANKSNNSDLEADSVGFLKNNASANKSNNSDLESDSVQFLANNLSANKPNNSDLEGDSEQFLIKNTSPNKSNNSDLESDSIEFLKNNISANKPNNSDLESDSSEFLKNNISANKPNGSDLEVDSAGFFKNNTSANKPNNSDLESDSSEFFKNNTSANKPNNSDLESDSSEFFKNNTSANKPNNSDLESDSVGFLKNNVSANKPNNSDLESDSVGFLKNNVSANKPNNSDLESDSVQFLKDNLAPNVPGSGDLLTDSNVFLNKNTAPNVPNGSDLLTDSNTFLNKNTAPNVPNGSDLITDSNTFLNKNVTSNVPNGSDLLKDSNGFLKNNLVPNVPNTGDLLTDSNTFLDNNLSSNVPKNSDLLSDSSAFRNKNLAANPSQNQLGVVVEGIGTSTFLGVSRVLLQGVLLRQVLFSKNKFQLNSNEYGTSTANLSKADFIGFHANSTRSEIQGQIDKNLIYNNSVAKNLQDKYGTNGIDSTSTASVGGGFFSVNTVGAKGGFFNQQDAFNEVKFDIRYKKGSITDAIRNYNLSRNLYNLNKLTPGDLQSMVTLQQNNDDGFQGLLASTIGYLRGNDSVGSQLQGNLIPRGILVANEGAYIKGGSPENILRPQQAQGMVMGSPESMMAQTVAGNPLNDIEFQAGTKGVKHIIKTIKNSDASKFSINYDAQNSQKYIIGTNGDGTPKVARQRFTIANPYKPGNAKTLLFFIENYSSGESFYFPPYIQDFSDSYGANWNSVNFLGRPEPVYTYNNSTREGNITFIVLTDYTQNLIIGKDFTQDSLSNVTINPRNHFTSKDVAQNEQKKAALGQASANQQEVNDQTKALQQYKQTLSGGTPEMTKINQDIKDNIQISNSIQKSQEDLLVKANNVNVYSETNNIIGNINNFMTSTPGRDAGDIDTKAEDSKKRIDQMIQSLAFQPAFFSGDKVDFLTKMEFLAKLTRPAKADEGSGFSFTRPPVCHIHLGDWWNSDIVIDSVSFSYADAPWTLDEGRVQPMWATVSMTFKFIGTYRGQKGGPVLSDEKGGFYQPRR